jgi:hypothetical protein
LAKFFNFFKTGFESMAQKEARPEIQTMRKIKINLESVSAHTMSLKVKP